MPRERTAPPTAWQVSVRWTFRLIHGASNTMNKPTIAQRRAQSARDKKLNKRAKTRVAKNKGRRAPLARSNQTVRMPPRIKSNKDRMALVHEEVIAEVNGTTGFGAQSLNINPGDPFVLPWGSQLALAYDFYIPHSITFEYRPSVPATTPGFFWIYADSDVLDRPPISFVRASGNAHCKSGSVWDKLSVTYPATFFHTRREFKIRRTSYPDSTTVDDYDCCRVHFGTQGLASPATVGYLVMKYHFTLINPTVHDTVTSSVEFTRVDGTIQTITSAAAAELDMSDYVVTKIEGSPPLELPEVGSRLANTALKFTRPFLGQLLVEHKGNNADVNDWTVPEQDAVAFSQSFGSGAPTVTTLTNTIAARNRGGTYYNDPESVDSFFLSGALPDLTMVPRYANIPAGKNMTLSTSADTIRYLFNPTHSVFSW